MNVTVESTVWIISSSDYVVLIQPALLCLGQLAGEKEDLVLDLRWARWAAPDIP